MVWFDDGGSYGVVSPEDLRPWSRTCPEPGRRGGAAQLVEDADRHRARAGKRGLEDGGEEGVCRVGRALAPTAR